ncbi:quinol monooxygenase YgiN [Aliiruegeria haliotis]|uniref:Quinol monooxygenase YgiN n=1 Tax=Aliiruegeria haliotis TaxID=1280846 RepID=A0A2T0RIP4_9RHOB|nr:putative quinol monooxygenase [Aliiruegeria haliotis]PRY20970.1 quinol monooxygenase YgiN [Aliiruegeria haliotis]
MSNFTLIVKLKLKPGSTEAFLPLIRENQRMSRDTEPGCLRFDVYKDNEAEDTFGFVEEYDSEDSFKAHQASDHFQAYFAQAKDMMVERIWQRCAKLDL